MTPKSRIIPVFVPHMGCPHSCVFCNQRSISGAKSVADAQTVKTAIAASALLNSDDDTCEIAFYGGSFTAVEAEKQNELLDAAQPFLNLNRENSIRISTRPDCIDLQTVLRLKSVGVKTIELGAQSMCDDVLTQSRRGHSAKDTIRASRIIKSAGLNLVLQMMTGLPGDTLDKSRYTAGEIAALKPDGVRIYPTVIVKDTELYEMFRHGEYREHTIDQAVEFCVRLLDQFSGIPIFRLGLNPTAELSGSLVAGGAYHPAFGELVYSRRYLNRARELIVNLANHGNVTLGVSRGRISMMVGQRRCNIESLKREFGLKRIKIVELDGIGDDLVLLESDG